MDAAKGMMAAVVDAATDPRRAAGLASQAQNLAPTGADAQRMYTALGPFRGLLPQSGDYPTHQPSRPWPWSATTTSQATPRDISSLLGRVPGMFPNGLPAAGADASDGFGQLSALFNSAQQLLQSDNPMDQLQGQQQLEQFQSLVQLFTTLMQIRTSMERMILQNMQGS